MATQTNLLDQLRPPHPFPARMAPEVALAAISELPGNGRVADPMVGSGTVAILAKICGHEFDGTDTDPLAVMLADVWCNPPDPAQLRDTGAYVLERARKRRVQRVEFGEEEDRFVDYWFDDEAKRQLGDLAASISKVRHTRVRRGLWCSFSRLIITKQSGVSRAIDVSHSRPHRVRRKGATLPYDDFLRQVERVSRSLDPVAASGGGGTARIRRGDARNSRLPSSVYDLVVSSPPYLNAIDYLRSHRLTLVWMGYSLSYLRRLRSSNVGTEVGAHALRFSVGEKAAMTAMGSLDELPTRHQAMVRRYVRDLRKIVSEGARLLRPHGRIVYVIGDSSFHGVFLRNSAALQALGLASGLRVLDMQSRELPTNRRYLPPPSAANVDSLGARMRSEVVITLEKAH